MCSTNASGRASDGGAVMDEARRGAVEWPTLLLLIACYAVWFLGTTWGAAVWLPLGICVTGVAIALQSSLCHEALHGHPFRARVWNEAVVFPCLCLLVPYGRFRDTHLAHHRDEHLTDPYDDPESNYLDPRVGPAAGLGAGRSAGQQHAGGADDPGAVYRAMGVSAGRLAGDPRRGSARAGGVAVACAAGGGGAGLGLGGRDAAMGLSVGGVAGDCAVEDPHLSGASRICAGARAHGHRRGPGAAGVAVSEQQPACGASHASGGGVVPVAGALCGAARALPAAQ